MTVATGAAAYTLAEAATPAETPPAGYAQDVYVDSRGCVYVRASIGTMVNWVPRLSRDRETVVCGVSPSAAAAATTAATTQTTAPAPTPSPTPAPAATQSASATPTAAPTAAAPAAVAPTASAAIEAAAVRATTPAPAQPATLAPAGAANPAVAEPAAAELPAAPVSRAAPAAAVRTIEVNCPADGSSARVRVGTSTVSVRCPAGMTRTASHVVTLGDGSQARLVAHPAATSGRVAGAPPLKGGTRGPMRSGELTAPQMASATSALAPARAAASVQVAPGARFVQVGAFGVARNAKNAVANLQGLGYGAATARTRSGLTLVMAGPFDDTAALKRALLTLRGYYPDAYTRG